jgi:hypothetical protein
VTTTTYSDLGIRTRQGVYWVMVIMFMVGANAVAISAQPDHRLQTGIAVFWLFALAVATVRNLAKLAALEKVHPEPTEAMKLLFQMTMIQPMIGVVPLLIGLRFGL